MTQRAVFFDRDATLIEDKHYMHKVEDIVYYDDSFSALKRLQDKNYKIFIVTNQSGIGRGMFNEAQMHEVHNQIIADYKDQAITIDDIAFCPHSPDQKCDCRKPSPKMILDLAQRYDVDLSKSFMVGDKISDAEAGKNSGATGLLLNVKDENFKSFNNLTEITNFILS
jgi:D-glycero-D-manno-heptose 1,7-bisphosphate phosphatase